MEFLQSIHQEITETATVGKTLTAVISLVSIRATTLSDDDMADLTLKNPSTHV